MSNEKFPEENNIFNLDEYRKKKSKDGGSEHLSVEDGKKGAVVSLDKYKEWTIQKRLMKIVNEKFPEENNIFNLDEYRKKKSKDGGSEHLSVEDGKKGAR